MKRMMEGNLEIYQVGPTNSLAAKFTFWSLQSCQNSDNHNMVLKMLLYFTKILGNL
jgi:hypothetical protein